MRLGLGEKLRNELSQIIQGDYIFLDIPYYTNIGDTLIWKGTEDFLKSLPYKCLYTTAIETYIKPTISEDVIILLQGGGNFGDLWRRHTDFCLRILEEFPNNKVIVLPQTIFYNDRKLMAKDAEKMKQHKNLTICARDAETFKLLSENFSSNIILQLPDMAFCISDDFLNKYKNKELEKQLFFKRKDKELYSFEFEQYLDDNNSIEEFEWPSMDKNLMATRILFMLKSLHSLCKKKGLFVVSSSRIVDIYGQKFYMPYLLKIGIQFISQYNYIYTTRLHGAILSILLNKSITFFDNSYGKNSGFYNTWLKDFKNIKMISK